MASKHLKELLSKDQEPFVLKSYIDEKLNQLSKSALKTHVQVKNRKPNAENSIFPRNFYRNACFFAYPPDVKGSPLSDFCSPVKSPFRNSNTLFVHIPARTAALLVEAALRIQKNSSLKKSKSRKSIGFGMFGSILKRITNRKRNRNDPIRWDSLNSETLEKETLMVMGFEDKLDSEMGQSCSCASRRTSVWTESNEEKSFDLETSSSPSEEFQETENADLNSCENGFCSIPLRLVLHNNNSLSPNFDIPKQSPGHINGKVVDNGNMILTNGVYDEEDKEQNSPVSILDPPFSDDEDEQEDDKTEDCFELESNFSNVQRSKQHLMHKLKRFEVLPDLEPVKLERRIAEDDDTYVEEQYDGGSVLSDNRKDNFTLVGELLTKSNMFNDQKISSDTKKLVQDLVEEERREDRDPCSRVLVIEKVCGKLESWKDVKLNTIDMMVDFDFRKDASKWAKNPEEMQETVAVIEFALFSFLMEELSDELVQGSDF